MIRMINKYIKKIWTGNNANHNKKIINQTVSHSEESKRD